ncbi:alpha/beta fold hydrolase [Halobellus litoreus]|uniref:Alpha/beta fold hydrolase n=1 Tax=Halobellus litoreus TaxID=755310 RepID=A0ABD6DY37_9EURY|nr:alpha/beta hydrolase [Halobellus litoreus]
MSRNWTRWTAGGVGLLFGVAGAALWRWKHRRLADLATGSELVETDHGAIEVSRRGSGSPVLVLHGAPGGYDQALAFGEAMVDDGVELIAPSRPGYLRTPLDGAATPSDQAALLDALLDKLEVEEALVIGLSAGGPSALHLASEYPERVTGLVLASAISTEIDDRMFDTGSPIADPILTSTPVLDATSGLMELLRRANPDHLLGLMHGSLSTLEGADLEEYVEFVRATPEQRERSLEFIPTVLPTSVRIDGTRNDERWCRELPLVDYGEIRCPTLVVHGEFDAAVPISHAEFLAETVPDVELHRVEADHLVWIGPDADRAIQLVREFTQSVTETAGRTEL